MRLRRFFFRILFSALFLVLCWAGGLLWFSTLIPREPVDLEEKVDAIVVFTGGSNRIQTGVNLLRTGASNALFISGVQNEMPPLALVARYDPKLAEAMQAEETNKSVELGYVARNTIGNVVETSEWIREKNISSIRLVTANYHMPRAVQEFRFGKPEITLYPDPVFPENFNADRWLLERNSLRLVLSEYHKYIAGQLRHRLIRFVGDA